jgi:predicted lipid-binding transport protein (Tim44 family)
MTPNTGVNSAARQPQAGLQRPGFMSGFGGTMMRGLLIGGLIGLLLGQGFGGLAGMFGFLLQALLIGGAIMLAIRFFRSQSAQGPAPALAGAGNAQASRFENRAAAQQQASSFTIPGFGGGSGGGSPADVSEEITLAQSDLDAFQKLLTDVQEAFGREDHAALRRATTPEMVSYLSEELADNAQKGLRNEVSDITLLQADIAESWREDDRDYATAALRYESRDVMRERASGKVVEGDENHPTETTELWTFTRQNGSNWKLSAIQQA